MFGDGENPQKSKFPVVRSQEAQSANREIGVPRGAWHSRGYLPHFECEEVPQHVTFHLADSLPESVLQQLENELKTLPTEKREAERRRQLDA
jgi:putative transposase